MVIYILLYLFLSFFIWYDEKQIERQTEKLALFFLVTVFTVFRGLRWNTGTDWVQFHETFLYADWSSIFSFQRYGDSKLEFGYVFLNVLVKSLGGDYTVFLLLTNFFVLFSFARFCLVVSKFPLLTFVIILYTTPFFPVRLNIAAAVLLYCYPFIIQGSFFRFLIPLGIAYTLHTSSLIFLPFYFILRWRIPTAFAISLFLLTMIGSNAVIQKTIMGFVASKASLLGDMVNLRLQSYMEFARLTENTKNPLLTHVVSFSFLLIFSGFRSQGAYEKSVTYNVCYNSFIAFFVISEFFRTSMEQLARTANYFSFGFPVLLAIVVSESAEKKDAKGFVYLLFIAYMFYKFYSTLNLYPDSNIPYRSIFD